MSEGRHAIRGSTPLLDLFRLYPAGTAALAARLGWPCALCAGLQRETVTMAARRHGNPPGAVLACFRALSESGPSEDLIAAACRVGPTRVG